VNSIRKKITMAKKIFVSLFILFAATLTVAAQTEQIVWEKDYKRAVAQARETGRPLLLDFTADWCKPCKEMDARFWVLADVIKAVQPFIAVKVDFDSEKGLVDKYRVSAIPFVVFADPLGNTITFRRGFSSKNVAELNQIFDEMPKDFSPLKKYYEAVEQRKDDGAAWLQIADAYRGAKILRLSNDFYKKALKAPEIQNDAEKRERIFATLAVNAYTYRDYPQAIDYAEDYLKEYPQGKNLETLLYLLVLSNANQKKMKNANKYLDRMKTEFAESKYLPHAEKALGEVKK
jgi:thiol-disulfide isomerase/thioredoxin